MVWKEVIVGEIQQNLIKAVCLLVFQHCFAINLELSSGAPEKQFA